MPRPPRAGAGRWHIHAARQLDEANRAPACAIALGSPARRCQTHRITVGGEHDLLDRRRQRQLVQVAGAERAPDREVGAGFSNAQAGLDALAEGEPSPRRGEADGAAAADAEHLLDRLDACLATSAWLQEGAM
jgi:hypothetical protein